MSIDFYAGTTNWNLVIHRVSQHSAEIWAGTLSPGKSIPKHANLKLFDETGNPIREISLQDWQPVFPKLGQGHYTLMPLDELDTNARYTLELYIKPRNKWQHVASGTFITLPDALPEQGETPFTLSLGSCFYTHADKGQAGAAYKALYEHGSVTHQPNISFLTGDQVYLDVGIRKLFSRILPQRWICKSVAREYAKNRKVLGNLLSRGGNWMLLDDHEYWNDYPFVSHILPKVIGLGTKRVRTPWEETAHEGVANVERIREIDTFHIGDDMSFCVADFRGQRNRQGFTSEENLARVIQWAHELCSPGILVISQPLLVEKRADERNMLGFEEQYARLIKALADCKHDIVVLSGDVHFGRIASVPIGENGNKLVEIIASPMSNLTGFYAIANQTAVAPPTTFPHPSIAEITGLEQNEVQYSKEFSVSTQKGSWFSPYWKERTKEHFMTISLEKLGNGDVELQAEAWRVRERSPDKMPVKDFSRTFKIQLS